MRKRVYVEEGMDEQGGAGRSRPEQAGGAGRRRE